MKTLFTFVLAMSMYLTSFAEPTKELAALSNVSLIDQKVKVTLIEGIGSVKVSVKNERGSTLYSTSLKVSESVIIPFNMESLPVGKYTIRIKTKDSSIDYNVETVKPEIRNFGFKANVKSINNQYVKVSVYELSEEGMITVKIFDKNNRLLHKEKVNGPFARKYTFKYLQQQGLYFSLTDKQGNNRIYYI